MSTTVQEKVSIIGVQPGQTPVSCAKGICTVCGARRPVYVTRARLAVHDLLRVDVGKPALRPSMPDGAHAAALCALCGALKAWMGREDVPANLQVAA